MAVLMSLNGNPNGDGFLLAPLDDNYDAELLLWTDAGTESVTLQASPNAANLVFSTAGVINLSTVPTSVSVHALLQSNSREDTTIEVLAGAAVVASFTVTSIRFPKVNFAGRFEARFATDGAYYNTNPMYTALIDNVNPPGWTWGLEGEPNFVPAVNNVPVNLEDTGMGRSIRLNNPVALRPHANPVTSEVNKITGETATGVETFTVGDVVIGQPVNFGPDTYFAGNQPSNPSGPQPEERFGAAVEPLGLFKIDIGNPTMYFRGASEVGPFTGVSTFLNERTRVPDSRPIATGLPNAAAELAEIGLPNLATFSSDRIDLLVADYNALPAGPSVQRRNLARRIGHLLSSVSVAKRNAVQTANPGEFTIRQGTLPPGWTNKEIYNGLVDADLHALSAGSSVIEYLRQFFVFDIQWTPFAFHSDELCGHHKGYLQGDPTMTGNSIGDPHLKTVDGTRYDFQSVGEFTLLRDGKKMEIQVRQSPVATQNPITDSYSGLTSCVSVMTAVAVRLRSYVVSLQPTGEEGGDLQFYVNGKPSNVTANGMNLGGNRITEFDSAGHKGIRIVTEDDTVVIITPKFWNNQKVWYMNVNVANTRAVEGIMGRIPNRSWLPRLRTGENVGPRPSSLADRYKMLYKTFANSWRINSKTSLFVYSTGTSTSTFTDKDWPAEKVPCKIKPEFEIPGVQILEGMPIEKAREICSIIRDPELNESCVFDVASTGDKIFAETYHFEQELRKCAMSVNLIGHIPPTFPSRDVSSEVRNNNVDNSFAVTASIKSLFDSKLKPRGVVVFYLNDKPISKPINLDPNGEAKYKFEDLAKGNHVIRANFVPSDEKSCASSSSSNLLHEVKKDLDEGKPTDVNPTDGDPPKKGCLGTAIFLMLLLLWLAVI